MRDLAYPTPMLGTHDFALFVAAGLLLNITPGPDMIYIIGRSTAQGWRAGAAAALGIGAGCFVHITAAALGVSAVLAASATAFTVLKIIGAAYLIYVGISMALAKGAAASTPEKPLVAASEWAIFVQGFFTNVLNPKVALFFLAFVPQFISADAPHKALSFMFLGAVFDLNGTLWNLLVAWLAARTSIRFKQSRFALWINRCLAAFFIFLGVRLAFAKAS
jgi:threonine/homoserine/homoserine lactone efflux protein